MGDVLTGRLARPAVQDFFRRFAIELDKHFDSGSHPDEQTKWLDYYLEKEKYLHKKVGPDMKDITEKDVRLMMAIYLWEVHYLIENNSREEPVMAAYDFVMSEDFRRWNKLNPVDLNEGIYQVVNDYVTTLDFSDPRVRKFGEALSMISARAGPSTPEPRLKYDRAPSFEDSEPEYDSGSESPESEYEDLFDPSVFAPPVATDPDSDSDSSSSVDGGPDSGLIELKYANKAIEMVLTIVRKKNPELHSSFFFVLHLYVLLKMYPTYQAGALSSELANYMNRKNRPLPFNAFLPIQDLVNEAIVAGISTNSQSVGQDDRTPEGLVLRELVEYCSAIKELLANESQKRTQSYREVDIEDLLSAKEFLNNVRAEINTNMLTSTTEEEMLEAIGQSNAPDWKKNLLNGVILAAAGAAVCGMVLGAKDAIAEGTANAARFSTVPGQYYTNTDQFDQRPPGFVGVDFGESPAPAQSTEVGSGFFQQAADMAVAAAGVGPRGPINLASNLGSSARRRRRRPRPTFFDHTLTV